MIYRRASADGFSASHVNGSHMSVAELNRIDISIIQDGVKRKIEDDENWFWFARLKVHPQERGKGLGKILLGEVASWADQNKINIFLGINPYGELDLEALVQLYSKFGFKRIGEDTMIREVT